VAGKLEPMSGIEPPTYGLRNRCSTTELHWLPFESSETVKQIQLRSNSVSALMKRTSAIFNSRLPMALPLRKQRLPSVAPMTLSAKTRGTAYD
jgi:hypothetical protein